MLPKSATKSSSTQPLSELNPQVPSKPHPCTRCLQARPPMRDPSIASLHLWSRISRLVDAVDAVSFAKFKVCAVIFEIGVPEFELGEGDSIVVFDFTTVITGFDGVKSGIGLLIMISLYQVEQLHLLVALGGRAAWYCCWGGHNWRWCSRVPVCCW